MLVQNLPHEGAYPVFVFHQQHGFSAATSRLQGVSRSEVSRCIHSRQIYLKSRADSKLAVNPNVAAALLDDAVHGGESQPSALTNFFGSEERLEDARFHLLRHSQSGIAYRDHYVTSRSHRDVIPCIGIVEIDVRSFDRQLPAAWHRIARVHGKIHNHLF